MKLLGSSPEPFARTAQEAVTLSVDNIHLDVDNLQEAVLGG